MPREKWGLVHPDKPVAFYDEMAVNRPKEGGVELSVIDYTHNGITPGTLVRNYENELQNIPFGVGLIRCNELFSYGHYKAEVILPTGALNWSAFWLWSANTSWLPEIDIFEAYTNKNGSYFKPRLKKPFGFWNIQTNVHYRHEDENKSVGGETSYIPPFCTNPTNQTIKVEMLWHPEFIAIYYNDRLVRNIYDSEVLKSINNSNPNGGKPEMQLIFNNMVIPEPYNNKKATPHEISNGRPFTVKSFKYRSI